MANKAESTPTPVTADNVAVQAPPPSYEEVMGHQTQGTVATVPGTELPPLAYIDMMPRQLDPGNIKMKKAPTFDKLSVLIEAANQWLRTNKLYAVWKCETIEEKVNPGTIIELGKMIYHESTFGFNVYVRGLRMWLTKKNNPDEPPQQLGVYNAIPEKKVVLPARHMGMARGMQMYPGLFAMEDITFSAVMPSQFITFDGLETTLNKLNNTLKDNPLQGTVLSVETVTMKSFEGLGSVDINPDVTCFCQDGAKSIRLTQIVRVFYVIGPPANEKIMLENFIPDVTKVGDFVKPSQFQKWPEVMSRISTWVPNQTSIRIVNLQTQYVRYSEFNGQVKTASDASDDYFSSSSNRKSLKMMRVFYVVPRSPSSQPLGFLSCRTFIPVRKGRKDYESMAETMFRITAWLKLTGLPIFSVETHHFPFVEARDSGIEPEKTSIMSHANTGKHFVTAISVYFPCPYQEPHPSYLPPIHYMYNPQESTSQSCNLL